MAKMAALLAMWLALAPAWSPQHDRVSECVERCNAQQGDPDVERQEIILLEKEAAHAIQLTDTTFFRHAVSRREGRQDELHQRSAIERDQVRVFLRFGH